MLAHNRDLLAVRTLPFDADVSNVIGVSVVIVACLAGAELRIIIRTDIALPFCDSVDAGELRSWLMGEALQLKLGVIFSASFVDSLHHVLIECYLLEAIKPINHDFGQGIASESDLIVLLGVLESHTLWIDALG